MPSTDLLDARFRPWADWLLKFARDLDARFVFTSTFRTRTEQQRLYNEWLKGLSPYPALPPGRSQHERGFAVDLARLNVDPTNDRLLQILGIMWRGAGGVWGGAVDPVHFEAPKAWTGRARSTSTRAARRRRGGRRR